MASDNMKLRIHTAEIPESSASDSKRRVSRKKSRKKSSMHERLMRNSCVACAVLLGVLALSNVDRPWAQKASGSIEKALTMKIDLDQSIGQMSFVQKIMPESALVFFNISGETDMQLPSVGKLTHAYSDIQPYLIFECGEDSSIYMPSDGIISALSQLSDNTWGALIDHGNGTESVIAGMKLIDKAVGDQLKRGDIIGSGSRIYYELREGGSAADPTDRFGL